MTRDLDKDDAAVLDVLLAQLNRVWPHNRSAQAYYDLRKQLENRGFSIPQRMQDLKVVAGWCGTVVDVLEERLDWEGWASPTANDDLTAGTAIDPYGLGQVYADNQLDVESSEVHLDALICGTSFVSVTRRDNALEPDPVVLGHSPLDCTGLWNPRTRWLDAALIVTARNELYGITEATLCQPDKLLTLELNGGKWQVADNRPHGLGRVPVVMFANRGRTSRRYGRSEITKAVRYYTMAAMRTLLGMEVHREFYNAPQRFALNVPEEAFTDSNGNPLNPWVSELGLMWTLPPNPNPDAPDPVMNQFQASSPAPYLEQIRGYQALLAAEAGIPESYLGIYTSNPSSADAIRALESRLVKRAQRRQTTFGRGWLDVAELVLLMRDSDLPSDFATLTNRWSDAATATTAATADAVSKLVGSEILPADSSVTWDILGLSAQQQQQLIAERSGLSADLDLAMALLAGIGRDDG